MRLRELTFRLLAVSFAAACITPVSAAEERSRIPTIIYIVPDSCEKICIPKEGLRSSIGRLEGYMRRHMSDDSIPYLIAKRSSSEKVPRELVKEKYVLAALAGEFSLVSKITFQFNVDITLNPDLPVWDFYDVSGGFGKSSNKL